MYFLSTCPRCHRYARRLTFRRGKPVVCHRCGHAYQSRKPSPSPTHTRPLRPTSLARLRLRSSAFLAVFAAIVLGTIVALVYIHLLGQEGVVQGGVNGLNAPRDHRDGTDLSFIDRFVRGSIPGDRT
jgi:hypothetical protein